MGKGLAGGGQRPRSRGLQKEVEAAGISLSKEAKVLSIRLQFF